MITSLKNRVLAGGSITPLEALELLHHPNKELLYEAAHAITLHYFEQKFDLCSIINAKSGRCSENCKWCAQSAHFKTQVEEYELLPNEECCRWAVHNEKKEVRRYSLVTSGKRLTPKQLDGVVECYEAIRKESSIRLCASMGLLSSADLARLKEAGVERYHCNLETAPSYFATLCTTHTQEQKIETLHAAKQLGMAICSGGIIGMGESPEQRLELAFTLRDVGVDSIPLNILQPIAGTPLADTPPLSDEDVLTTIALFRFINPQVWLRFAGGRAQLSEEMQRKAIYIGMNSAIVGDMLTTTGSRIDEDKQFLTHLGYNYNYDK